MQKPCLLGCEPEPFSSSASAGNQFHRRAAPVEFPLQPRMLHKASSHIDSFMSRKLQVAPVIQWRTKSLGCYSEAFVVTTVCPVHMHQGHVW